MKKRDINDFGLEHSREVFVGNYFEEDSLAKRLKYSDGTAFHFSQLGIINAMTIVSFVTSVLERIQKLYYYYYLCIIISYMSDSTRILIFLFEVNIFATSRVTVFFNIVEHH